MHPSKFGDTYEMAKLCMLHWLAPDEEWLFHPMYFPPINEEWDETFACRYADFLGVRLAHGNIKERSELVDAVAENPGHLFLDPDTGLRLDNAKAPQHVNVNEFIAMAHSPTREHKLVLVYDQSIDRRYNIKGTPNQQLGDKLRRLHEADVHAAAYVSHIAFIWASTDPEIVSAAARRLVSASHLPDFRLVDDGCAHIPNS